MKHIINLLFICIVGCICSCSDLTFGDKFLGSQPESSGAILDTMFSSKAHAEEVLNTAYTFLPYGLPTGDAPRNKLGGNILEALTDLYQSFRDQSQDGPRMLYYNGMLSASVTGPDRQAYYFGSETQYKAIRYALTYIENVDRVPDMSEKEKNERIAEAKMIIAISYAEMLRYVGGVAWVDHAIEITEPMNFPRITFAETVQKIVALLDEAIPDLKWKQSNTEDGRMTKAGAMGLKLRVLLFAASPTFNSDKKWHEQADEYTCYGNYDSKRWEAAMKAGEDFMNELKRRGIYQITQPKEETAEARRLAYRSGYYNRGGTEVLISTRQGYNETVNQPLYDQRFYSGPTLNYVNMFSWADGTEFPENFNWENPEKQPFFERNGTLTRDPRLYENVAVPGSLYFNDRPAPVYYGNSDYRPGQSGFLMMKFILPSSSDRTNVPTQWPYLRLPEVLLSYAEAINEFKGAPDNTAFDCLNQVRTRVGLPGLTGPMNQKTFREAILHERALEFGFEEVRWFDLVRWGREKDFQKKLYGLESIVPEGEDKSNPAYLIFKGTYEISSRYWATKWDTKWYLSPIPQKEINMAYGMTQNPGW
ncbi:RagB/SusD family nutrient uptake outer membrane protein [uncultured Bacteroides sp.]|uniref:RagB/SusD family nutrient uptake outer membrane protein n=1 Tax=uncultured Bacteroides sp. TaxID=162156 RepID=UPI0026751AC3|nr:RagB/SusD family nutrient uptake outer membrane protein [uncultured Bacteroides sp.]